jgi:cyclopropane fatty-acyl-phospholipid synthase-like methyltransferase
LTETPLQKINPFELFLWTFRRNEKDVINLYNSLSNLMKISSGGDMLNFGYWNDTTNSLLEAQKNMCQIFAQKAQLQSKQHILDVGSGIGSPAIEWSSEYAPVEITCININFGQLQYSINNFTQNSTSYKNFNLLNATATLLPFENSSMDRVLALESAQHFKPLKSFITNSYRILKKNGILALAIPVVAEKHILNMIKLGILSLTWSSEHYDIEHVKALLKQEGFHNINLQKIGSNVYEPLARYYTKNRESLKSKILKQYPSYVEKILFKSIIKMNEASKKNIIDYILVTCQK